MDQAYPGWRHVKIGGVVSLHSKDFQEKLDEIENTPGDLSVDLLEVVAMDSAAVGALLRLRTKRERKGHRCRFYAQLPGLCRLLHIAGVRVAETVS